MELRVIEYFLTIAREGSISKAADVLHITQPTLSRQMKELEKSFGKQLFIRGNRKLTLTKDGMIFKQYASEIVNLVEKTKSEMLKSEEELSGEIYIGSGESSGMRLVMKVIANMQKLYPHVTVHIHSGNAQDIAYKLNSGLLDFGVFIDPVDLSKYDYYQLPIKEKWGVLMRRDSDLSRYEKITADMLKNYPVILSDQEIVKNEIAGWIGGNDRKLDVRVTYNLIHNAALLVGENGGYALTFQGLVHTDEKSLLCFRPLEPILEEDIHIAWKKYHVFSKQAEKFLELLKEEVKHRKDDKNDRF